MKDHYAGSIAFDNHNDVWQDETIIAFSFKELVKDMKELMTRRRNSEVFFAAVVRDGKEIDITERVRVAVQ
jgi:hypothetical protein|tara:strand:+ start:112 stop:324 length:213 start_codon:yes stop_codon:yes gene_type:complete